VDRRREGLMRWYIAGKITGNPDFRAQFAAAADKLRADGFTVVNPAENPWQPSWERYMAEAIPQLCGCDGVALLPNWRESEGAQWEHNIAERLKMPRLYL
jgi:hypothetical protein